VDVSMEYRNGWLVVWMNFNFPYVGNVIIPTDELIFFRGVGIPPTRGYDGANVASGWYKSSGHICMTAG